MTIDRVLFLILFLLAWKSFGQDTIDTVQIYVPYTYLNIAEVWFYNGATQVSQSTLTFSLSSLFTPYVASLANDGNIKTFAHSQIGGTLTIKFSVSTIVNTIIIYNRYDCCQSRLNGAYIKGYLNSNLVWLHTVPSTSAMSYTFYVGGPSSEPTSRPTNPTGHPTSNPTNPTSSPSGNPSNRPTDLVNILHFPA